jgi:hypothetical protein
VAEKATVRRAHRAILAILGLPSLAACVAVLGMDELSEGRGVDASSEASAPPPGPCLPPAIAEPDRPPPQDKTVRDSVFFAFRELDFGIDAAAEPAGYDLDRTKTTDLDGGGSCLFADGGDVGRLEKYWLDPPSGVDNAVQTLIQTLGTFVPTMAPEIINRRLVDRRYGLVLRIDGWNGTANDDDIRVLVFPTIGYWLPLDDGGLSAEGDRPEVPPPTSFEPDEQLIADQRFQAGEGSTLFSLSAWIANGRLVARFDDLTVPIRSSIDELRAFDISLHEAWITGTLVPTGGEGRPALERGVIAGRLGAESLLREMALLFDTQTRTYACAGRSFLTGLALDLGCSARDIRAGHCDDRKRLPCNALSFGARFETYAVDRLGPFRGRTDDEYRSEPERLPPGQRCLGIDAAVCSE